MRLIQADQASFIPEQVVNLPLGFCLWRLSKMLCQQQSQSNYITLIN